MLGQPMQIKRSSHGPQIPEKLTIVLTFDETESAIAQQLKELGAMDDDTTTIDPRLGR